MQTELQFCSMPEKMAAGQRQQEAPLERQPQEVMLRANCDLDPRELGYRVRSLATMSCGLNRSVAKQDGKRQLYM